AKRVWVVHGSDGLDEITTTGATNVAALEDGQIHVFNVTPENVGLARATPEALRGGDAKVNAAALLDVLNGKKGAYRDIAVINAAAAIVVADRTPGLREAVALAEQSVDSGAARGRLERLIAISNS